MITLPYCFLNTEIRSTIKQHWERWRLNRGSDPYIEGKNRSRFSVQVGHETTIMHLKVRKSQKQITLVTFLPKKMNKKLCFWDFLTFSGNKHFFTKDWGAKKIAIYFPIFYWGKSSGNILFFYLVMLLMKSLKSFEKIARYFKNMTAGFLPRCQNLLRYFTPKIMHFQAWKKLIFTNIAL